jgi:hypothetical protein
VGVEPCQRSQRRRKIEAGQSTDTDNDCNVFTTVNYG